MVPLTPNPQFLSYFTPICWTNSGKLKQAEILLCTKFCQLFADLLPEIAYVRVKVKLMLELCMSKGEIDVRVMHLIMR